MNVSGFARITCSCPIVVLAVSARHCRFRTSTFCSSAIRSTTRKPKLCGVSSYSDPGLPSPTISFTFYFVVRRTSFVVGRIPYPWHGGVGERRTTNDQGRFSSLLFFLLRLLRRSCRAFLFRLLLALLHDFGFGRSGCRFASNRFRRGHFFFLDADDVRDRLIGIAQKFDLVVLR